MQPTNATLASGGAAGLAVIVLAYALTQFGIDVPAYVQIAAMGLLTWAWSNVFHGNLKPPTGGAAAVVGCFLFSAGLGGCAAVNGAISGATNYLAGSETAAKANVQHVDDLNLSTWAQLGCMTPYGALVRNSSGNPALPTAIVDLCGLPSGINVIKTTSGITLSTGTGPTIAAAPAAPATTIPPP